MRPQRKSSLLALAAAAMACLLAACVYRLDTQQGNLLDEDQVAEVEVGMTRSQVRFLLGTPMVADPFTQDRWDYMFYFRRGKDGDPIRPGRDCGGRGNARQDAIRPKPRQTRCQAGRRRRGAGTDPDGHRGGEDRARGG